MKRWWPILILILALALGALSPLASSLPDGLESVAEHLGFAGREKVSALPAPLPDYALPGREGSRSLAGIGGSLLVFGAAWALGRALSRRRAS
jgi:hypothetical protein